MEKNKEKKKTLTITSSLKKKIDPASFHKKEDKKSFAIKNEKKKFFKDSAGIKKNSLSKPQLSSTDQRKKKFTRKFIEQQATKALLKKMINQQEKANLSLKRLLIKEILN